MIIYLLLYFNAFNSLKLELRKFYNKMNTQKNLIFIHNNLTTKIISFNRLNMSVDVNCYDKNNNFIKKENIVFAQLPKKIKKLLNPK